MNDCANLRPNKAPNRKERGFEAGYQPDRIQLENYRLGPILAADTTKVNPFAVNLLRCRAVQSRIWLFFGDSPCLNCAWLAGRYRHRVAKLPDSDTKAGKSLLTIRWLRARVLQDREQPTFPLNRGIVGGLFPNRFTILV